MNNEQLKEKLKELVKIDDYIDLTIAMKGFEKDYKTSDFYKLTKKSLESVIKEAKVLELLSLEGLKRNVQNLINTLDLSHISELLDQTGNMFEKENAEITSAINNLDNIVKKN